MQRKTFGEEVGRLYVLTNSVLLQEGSTVHAPMILGTSLRAELTGAINDLRRAAPPIRIHVDNSSVVKGFAAGKSETVTANNPAADLWRLFWNLIEDFGRGVEILKCKGHATQLDIAEGRATVFTKNGNDGADRYAVYGREWAEDLAPTDYARAEFAETVKFYPYLLFSCG